MHLFLHRDMTFYIGVIKLAFFCYLMIIAPEIVLLQLHEKPH